MNLQTKHHSLTNVVKSAVKQMKDNKHAVVEDILTKVVIECLKKFEDKVNVGVQDSVADLLDTFRTKIASDIFDIAQTWSLTTSREKVLFPKNCRFLYNMGTSTIVVIEEPPMFRTLTLDRNLLGEHMEGNSRVTRQALLPLPYTTFIMHFINSRSDGKGRERLSSMYVFWNSKPLESLTDMLYEPILPNIHQNYSLCMGHDFSLTSTTISEMVREAVNEFWSSAFNNDLSMRWWAKDYIDNRLRTVAEWEQLNPLDMFEMNYHAAMPLDRFINTCVGAHEEVNIDASMMRRRLAETIDNCVSNLFNKVLKYFRKTKFDKFYPKDIVENLGTSITSISDELIGLVLGMELELKKLSDGVRNSKNSSNFYGWEPKGGFWTTSRGTDEHME